MLSPLILTFITIVERGTITRAAIELALAKSAVSQNLKRLENDLGVKLATRTTRRFSLTPAGERYYRRCKELLALSKMAATEMEDFGAMPAGPITVTAPHALIAPLIAPAITKVLKKFPDLRPSVVADDKCLNLIESGIDVSITVGELQDSSHRARKLGVLRDTLCVSRDLLDTIHRGELSKTISAIESLPYIAHSREQKSIEHSLSNLNSGKKLLLKFEPTLFCNSVEAQITFVKEGLGIALLPDLAIAKDLENSNVVCLYTDYSLSEEPVYALHAYDTMPPKSVIEIINAIQVELNK